MRGGLLLLLPLAVITAAAATATATSSTHYSDACNSIHGYYHAI